jgi:transposase InsO family protein
VPVGGGEPREFLSLVEGASAGGRGRRGPLRRSASRAGTSAPVRFPARHRCTAQAWDGGESKRVARIMQEDNLLAVQPRSFVATTDSEHALEVYLNVASRMKVKGANQPWVADITYIRLKNRVRVPGGGAGRALPQGRRLKLDQTLATRLPLAALVRAIAKRKPRPGLVHHSDRGVQYASGDYVAVLRRNQMIPS